MSQWTRFSALVVAATFTSAASAVTYTGPGGTLVDGSTTVGVFTSDVVITGTGETVSALNSVTLTGLSHTYIGDLEIRLSKVGSPTATEVLISPPDLESADFFDGDYTFIISTVAPTVDEVAATSTSSAFVVPSGTYAASTYGGGSAVGPRNASFSSLEGIALDGTWRLQIADFAAGDSGSLEGFSFDVTTAVPEPTTLAALSLGGLLFRRRR